MSLIAEATAIVEARLKAEMLTVAKRLSRLRAAAHRLCVIRLDLESATRLAAISNWAQVVDHLGQLPPRYYGGAMPDLLAVVEALEGGQLVPLRPLLQA